jgi:hypothetical protein
MYIFASDYESGPNFLPSRPLGRAGVIRIVTRVKFATRTSRFSSHVFQKGR